MGPAEVQSCRRSRKNGLKAQNSGIKMTTVAKPRSIRVMIIRNISFSFG